MTSKYTTKKHFSKKYDVFNYGILFMKIINGRKNINFYNKRYLNRLGYISLQTLHNH